MEVTPHFLFVSWHHTVGVPYEECSANGVIDPVVQSSIHVFLASPRLLSCLEHKTNSTYSSLQSHRWYKREFFSRLSACPPVTRLSEPHPIPSQNVPFNPQSPPKTLPRPPLPPPNNPMARSSLPPRRNPSQDRRPRLNLLRRSSGALPSLPPPLRHHPLLASRTRLPRTLRRDAVPLRPRLHQNALLHRSPA